MMRTEEIKNGRIFVNNGYGTIYNFEIVKKVPASYSVWCLPEICDGEYIPFCMTVQPENKDCYDVNINTIKAIKVTKEEAAILSEAAHYGAGSLVKAKKLLNRTAKTTYMKNKQEKARKALPILEKITK